MESSDFRRQMGGYGLTTAHIFYRRPDHPWLLQSYVWQEYDLCPKFPELQRFLAFWQKSLDGMLHSVTVAHSRLIKPAEINAADGVFRLHWFTFPNVCKPAALKPPDPSRYAAPGGQRAAGRAFWGGERSWHRQEQRRVRVAQRPARR
jgi:uncharacterized protein Usg